MKINLEYDKKNNMHFLIVFLLAWVMYFSIDFGLWAVLLYGAAYYLIKSLKIELKQNLFWLWTGILFVAGSALTIFSVQYLILDPENFMRTSNVKILFNILCCIVVYLIIQLFTNNPKITCIIGHIGVLCFGFVDYFVYSFRGNEFTFADLKSVGTGLSVAGSYQLRLNDRGAYVILLAGLYVALMGKFEITFQSRVQMTILSILIAMVCGLFVFINTMDVTTETWEQKGTYRNGYLLNFMLGVRDSFVGEPEGYSEEVIRDLEEKYAVSDNIENNTEENPTIIVVMNESFADLGVIGELETNVPLTPFIDSLEANTIKGYTLSSVFGAKTPNSEWEYMTGNSMAFLPSGSVVYQQYISDEPASMVSTLKNGGYTCVAMHPYYDTGWSRNQVYPDLGFDEMYFLDDFDQSQVIREYITDRELYRKIIDRYESKASNEDLFIMSITMQNHGGYTDTYENFTEDVYKTGLSYTDVNQYLSLIHESDQAVEELINYFSSVEEPVEIVFFGDHQPGLNSAFYQLMNGKGLSGLTQEELENLYKVPFFIWTNYETEARTVDITSLNFLSTMTLERAGIELPAYNQFLSDMMEVIPAINARGYYSNETGTYLHIEDATGEEADWLQKYNMLQYNSMFDKKNRSEIFFPYMTDSN